MLIAKHIRQQQIRPEKMIRYNLVDKRLLIHQIDRIRVITKVIVELLLLIFNANKDDHKRKHGKKKRRGTQDWTTFTEIGSGPHSQRVGVELAQDGIVRLLRLHMHQFIFLTFSPLNTMLSFWIFLTKHIYDYSDLLISIFRMK